MKTNPSLKIYVASKAKRFHLKLWRRLRDELAAFNIVITSSWITLDNEPHEKDAWIKLWTDCISEASSCSILLALYRVKENPRGQNVEIGAALASGVPVYIVRPKGLKVGDFCWHPLITLFDSLDEALESIKEKA